MNTSPETADLSAALAVAQGQFKPLVKNKTNPHLGNPYADLSAVREATIDALSQNGLSLVQAVETGPVERSIKCVTRLMHKSGQWIESELALPIIASEKQNYVQQAGAVITYLRRYTHCALLGIAADDDADGEAGKSAPRAQARPAAAPATAPAPNGDVWEGPGQCPKCHAPEGKKHGKPCVA